jgi:hypothetical protein
MSQRAIVKTFIVINKLNLNTKLKYINCRHECKNIKSLNSKFPVLKLNFQHLSTKDIKPRRQNI